MNYAVLVPMLSPLTIQDGADSLSLTAPVVCYGFLKEASRCRIETLRNVDLEQVLRPKFDAMEDRCDGIPPRSTGAQPIEMGGEFPFPCGFQGLAPQRLSRPFVQGRHAQRPLFRSPAFWYPDTS